MAEASLEAPAQGGSAPQAGGSNPPPQEPPAAAARAEDYIEVKAEKDRATLMVRGSAAKDAVSITRDTVAVKLTGLKVTAGVDWKAVDEILASKLYDKTHVIASSTLPVPGRDAWIEEKLKIDPDVKPVMGKNGTADYRNVDNIHQVKKGDVLAVRHPPVPGANGMDIYGKPNPAPAAKDTGFKLGLNTEISADGLWLLASTGGYVFHQAGAISVGVTYALKGDVDYQSGNLHYQGDIVVMGNVTDGFTVEAEGDITIEGSVEAAEVISKNGSVTVKQGVFGHNKGRIRAKTVIRLQGAQDVDLECDGEIIVEKGLRNCKAVAAFIRADKPGCSVVGGRLKAYREIAVAALGGEGCHTELILVDKEAEAARLHLKEIEKQRLILIPRVEAMEKKLKGMKALAERFGGELSTRARGELKTALDQYGAMRKEQEALDLENARLGHAMNSAARQTGKCLVTEKMVWGGIIDLYGHLRELEAEDAKKEWVWSSEGLVGRLILPDPKPSGLPGQPDPPADPPA